MGWVGWDELGWDGMGWDGNAFPRLQGHSTPCLRCLLQEHPVLQLQPHGDSLCTFTSPPAIVPIYEP